MRFCQRQLAAAEIKASAGQAAEPQELVADWRLDVATDGRVADATGGGHDGTPSAASASSQASGLLAAGLCPPIARAAWQAADDGSLRLTIPAGSTPLKFTLFVCRPTDASDATDLCEVLDPRRVAQDLAPLTGGGPLRWTEVLTTEVRIGADDGPFAVDYLMHPESNPWLAEVRLTARSTSCPTEIAWPYVLGTGTCGW